MSTFPDKNYSNSKDNDIEDQLDTCSNTGTEDVKSNMFVTKEFIPSKIKTEWTPGIWSDGSRKSAFQPYKPTTVLTNFQRGNIATETNVQSQDAVSLHHKAGQGELNAQHLESEQGIDVLDCNGLSLLMWAAYYGQMTTVQTLIQHGANVNLEGKDGETALLLAAANGHHDVVRFLLIKGAPVNYCDHMGNTALMYSAYKNHPHCTNELLIGGADITITNTAGNTAYEISIRCHSHLVQAVMENHLLTFLS